MLVLALLRRALLEIDPAADVTPETLLASVACVNCYGTATMYELLEIALLWAITEAV